MVSLTRAKPPRHGIWLRLVNSIALSISSLIELLKKLVMLSKSIFVPYYLQNTVFSDNEP